MEDKTTCKIESSKFQRISLESLFEEKDINQMVLKQVRLIFDYNALAIINQFQLILITETYICLFYLIDIGI